MMAKRKIFTDKTGRGGQMWETVKTIVYAVLIATFIRTLLYEPFNIPSGSMIPTLLVGDYLFVSKMSYGYSRYSFPLGVAPFTGRVFQTPPVRGDVAVFKLPRDNETDYIKRIVGLPGDRIQVIDGVLYINDEPVKRESLDDYAYQDRFGNHHRVTQYLETLPNGVSYRVLDSDPAGSLDNTQVYSVPEGHYFAMGDNRDRSADSRVLSQVGFIPAENLVGRAEILFFSTNGGARLWQIWRWPFAIRFTRIGELL